MNCSYWISPIEANLLITGKCNLNCVHCSVNSYGKLSGELSLTDWIVILEKLVQNKVIFLTITGGEPMCRNDFTDFILEVYSRPFRFSINTNATLISDKIISALLSCSGRLDNLMVSFDGPDTATIDSQRGHSVGKAVFNGIEKIAKAGIRFGAYCTVTSNNVDKLRNTALKAISMGAEWIKFNNFLYAGPELSESVIPSRYSVIKAAEDLLVLSQEFPGKIHGSILEFQERLVALQNSTLKPSKGKAFQCGGGTGKIAVFPDGKVTPCDHLPDYGLGNILTSSLESILTGTEMHKFTEYLNRNRSEAEFCNSCEYSSFCTGGCPVEALAGESADLGIDRHSCLKLAMECAND